MGDGRLRDVFRRCANALFEEAPETILVTDVSDDENLWTKVNAAGCEMLGYSRKELDGVRLVDLVPPEDVMTIAPDREALRVPGRIISRDASMRRKDGTSLPVEIRVKILPDGRAYAFVRDVSERKRAEREREESLRWLRAVLEQCPVGIVLLRGPQGHRVESNRCAQRMFGLVDHIDGYLGVICAPDGRPLEFCELPARRALRGEVVVDADLLARREDGSYLPVSGYATPLIGADGSVLGAVGAFQDITARKELERLRAEWGSVVAHDLRQPLGSISLQAQALARATEDARVLKTAERILAAAQRMNRMVGDLMDLSRLEAHRLELLRQPVDVPALVRDCVEHMALEAADRSFDVRVQGDVPEACADPDRIAQVMENLLTNAVKYGTAGTPIVATIACEGGEVAVAVTNEGQALTAEDFAHLFERFQRTDPAKRSGIPGVGLGLYITRSLVEAHGGRIIAESEPPGVNTFRFTLPVAGPSCGS